MWRTRAFSLVEVVIAVGVLAIAVVAILGLLPALTREAAEATEHHTAQHLSAALQLELQRRVHASGLDAVAASIPSMGGRLERGARFVTTRDGSSLRSLGMESGGAGDFFLVEVWRFDDAPLAHAPGSAGLALYVQVAWPYWASGAAVPTPASERTRLAFTLALNP